MIIHIPFIHSLRLRSLLLLPPPVTNSYRPTRIRLYTNLAQPPSFSDIEDGLTPVQDLNLSQSPSLWQAGVDSEGRAEGGRREVEEWPLKVQKMASVWSVTLMIVSAWPLRLSVYDVSSNPVVISSVRLGRWRQVTSFLHRFQGRSPSI